MTREEAKRILEETYSHWLRLKRENLLPNDECVKVAEALDMAISALSANTIPIEKYHELQHQFVMLGATFADLTEVVRCKDCEYYQGVHGVHGHAPCEYFSSVVSSEDYCSRAKMKGGADNG